MGNNNKALFTAAALMMTMLISRQAAAQAPEQPAGQAAAGGQNKYLVQGKVYCDPCKVQFETRLSKYMAGAKVRLQCKKMNEPGEPVTLTLEELTNKDGVYSIPVEGEHQDEICEVKLVKSSDEACKVIMENGMEKTRVMLSENDGMDSSIRFANSLGYMTEKADDDCPDVLADMGFLPDSAAAGAKP